MPAVIIENTQACVRFGLKEYGLDENAVTRGKP
jgi:hypothetical protein